MAYTTTDLANIQAAKLALVTGTREVRVQINGKMIEYSEVNLDALNALETLVLQSLGTVTTRAYARNIKRFER